MIRWFKWAVLFLGTGTLSQAQNTRPADTPPIVQVQVGPTYDDFPEDGGMYCVPSSYTMDLFWLRSMGFTTLAPAYDANSADNLDRVIAGLMQTGTGPKGGTTGTDEKAGMSLYLNLKGLSGNYTTTPLAGNSSPTFADLESALNGQYQFAVINIAWYKQSVSDPTTYNYNGGHDVSLLNYVSTGAESGTATINNPEPRSLYSTLQNTLANVQQSPDIAPVSSSFTLTGGADGPYLQFITPSLTGDGNHLAVIAGVGSWNITTGPGFTPATFTLTNNETVNTNGGSFTAETPIADGTQSYGITKTGQGTMSLSGNITTKGTWTVNNGTLQGIQTTDGLSSTTPFGTGHIEISGDGVLDLSPATSTASAGNRNVSLLLASGSGSSLSVQSGNGNLFLNRGANDSLTVSIGGNTSGTDFNLVLNNNSTLIISSTDGMDQLGGTTKLFLQGTASNQYPIHNGITFPGIVGQNNDSAKSAVFLTYGGNGFTQASTVAGSNFIGTDNTTIFSTTDNINLGSGTATVAGLSSGYHISGTTGSSLNILPDGAQTAGLLLDGSNISVESLNFGARSGYIYSSTNGGAISSAITANDLVTYGPGETALSGTSAAISGSVFVNSGTLKVSNQGIGNAAVTVQQNATLKVAGSLTGAITSSGTILLEGGTVSGPLTLGTSSIVAGTGTISTASNTTLQGNLGSTTAAGNLRFETTSGATVAVTAETIFNFTLTSLTGQTAGQDWTFFDFANGLDASNGFTVNLNFTALTDPPIPPFVEGSDLGYWSDAHEWQMMYLGADSTLLLTDITLPEGSLFASGKFTLGLEDGPDNGQYLTLSYQPIPEPSTVCLLFLGGGMLLHHARRRRLI